MLIIHANYANIINANSTKEIIAVKESLYVVKHTCIFPNALNFSPYTKSILKTNLFVY